jgi:hypothetical protein
MQSRLCCPWWYVVTLLPLHAEGFVEHCVWPAELHEPNMLLFVCEPA